MHTTDLKKIPLFEKMPPEVLSSISSHLTTKTLKKEQLLFAKDDIGDALFIIKSGKIKISIPTEEGEELIVTVFSDGDFFGELSVLDKAPRSADAVAMTDTTLLVLHRNSFYSFLIKNTEALKAIMTALCQRLRKTDEFLTDICFTNFSKRLVKKLLELINQFGKQQDGATLLDLKMTQKDLGSMLGVTRETVNRELKYLRDEGILTKDKNRIIVNDLGKLIELL